jgi:putative ATP-dependent endonuclease of the OLD family
MKRSKVFAIEEPEMFLHPTAQEELRDDLEALAERKELCSDLAHFLAYSIKHRPAFD